MFEQLARWIDLLFQTLRYTLRLDPQVSPQLIQLFRTLLGWTEPEVHQFLQRVSEKIAFAVILYTQVLATLAIWWWCTRWEVWWSASILAVVTYAVCAYRIDRRLWQQINAPQPVQFGSGLWWLMGVGVLTIGTLLLLLSWVLLQRLDVHWGVTVSVPLSLGLFAVLLGLAGGSALVAGRVPWAAIGAASVLLPLGVSWVSWSVPGWLFSLRSPLVSLQPSVRTDQGGIPCPEPRTWTVNGKEHRVVLALSGGGYRAAIVHAGLLAALDEQKVAVAYVSTVSGGSIIGAAYALGVAPSSFATRLLEGKPGLPHDLFNVVNFSRGELLPSFSNADAYSAHFQRVFFGDARLSDLPASPILLMNATDLEAEGVETRAIFFRGNPALHPETSIADLVAASGAFPVAFQPKQIAWGQKTEKFVDGGIVENLGVEGMMRYLAFPCRQYAPCNALPRVPRTNTLGIPSVTDPHLLASITWTALPSCPSAPPPPDILIISDASHRGGIKQYKSKVELTTLALRAEELSYDALHRHLYARYTGQPDFGRWLLEHKDTPQTQVSPPVSYTALDSRLPAAGTLRTVVVPFTADETGEMLTLSPYSHCRFSQDPPYISPPPQPQVEGEPIPTKSAARFCEKHRPAPHTLAGVFCAVSQFDTLQELDATQVRQGFWLGYHLGKIYGEAIKCAASLTSSPDADCPAPQASPEDFCRSFEHILSQTIPH